MPEPEQGDEEPPQREAPVRIDASQLTGEQRSAADRALAGESLFLTGAAGTGKSFLLRYIIQELEQRHTTGIAVTAPTGIAAVNIGGQTIHSFAGVGLGTGSSRKLLNKVKKSAGAVKRWKEARALVVDEVSMLDAGLFSALEAIAASLRGVREGRRLAPFGGLQLILCGDFLQLPPIQGRGEDTKCFCFQTPAWSRCGLDRGTIVLMEAVRQAADSEFAGILNEVRRGVVSLHAQDMLARCHVDVKEAPQDGIIPTKLYCLNKNVDAENKAQLAKLTGRGLPFRAKDHFTGRKSAQQRMMLQEQMDKKVPSELQLKVGAQVILIKNQTALKLVNGSRGIVESFEERWPVVRFDNGQCVRIGQEAFTQGGSDSLTRVQVPLKLGWALTVHKAQGMTLTRAELDVDKAFEAGQTYVALSRLTSTTGLWIRGQGISHAEANPAVLGFYENAERGLAIVASQAPLGCSSSGLPMECGVPRLSPSLSSYFASPPLALSRDERKELDLAAPASKKRGTAPQLALAAETEGHADGFSASGEAVHKRRRLQPLSTALNAALLQSQAPSESCPRAADCEVLPKTSRNLTANLPNDLTGEVLQLLGQLNAEATPEGRLHALQRLRALGSLPVSVLRETLVGKSVSRIARESGTPEAVRTLARELVHEWRLSYRSGAAAPAAAPVAALAAAPAVAPAAALRKIATVHSRWVSPPRTWGGGVIELDD